MANLVYEILRIVCMIQELPEWDHRTTGTASNMQIIMILAVIITIVTISLYRGFGGTYNREYSKLGSIGYIRVPLFMDTTIYALSIFPRSIRRGVR